MSYPDGSLYYAGDWEADQQHGHGTVFAKSGLKYEGGWINGRKHGTGKMTDRNGMVYEILFEMDQEVRRSI